MMNAFAVGRRDNSVVAVTDQLIRALTARELTGVLAHEISHIRNEDLKVMALADTVSRFTSLMSTVGIVSLLFNITWMASGSAAQVPWLGVIVLLFAPTIGGLLQMALSRTREFDADLGAAMLTGDPDGLANALTKLEKAQGKVWENLILPGGRIPDPSILRTHPLTEARVARLHALKEACAIWRRAAIYMPDVLASPLKPEDHIRTRPRSVPQIGQQYGRWNSNNLEILSLINTQAIASSRAGQRCGLRGLRPEPLYPRWQAARACGARRRVLVRPRSNRFPVAAFAGTINGVDQLLIEDGIFQGEDLVHPRPVPHGQRLPPQDNNDSHCRNYIRWRCCDCCCAALSWHGRICRC